MTELEKQQTAPREPVEGEGNPLACYFYRKTD